MDRLVDFLINFYGPTPYFVIFGILLACGLGLPIPEDITLFAAGLLAYYGITNVYVTIAVCFLGVMLGDFAIFWLGATYGKKLTRKWFFHKLLPDDRLAMVQAKIKKKGNRLVFAARFMPGLRAPVYFTAGSLHLPYRVFLFYDGLAALISVPAIVGAVYYFGDYMDKVVRVIQRIEHGIIFVIAAVILTMGGKWYITHRKVTAANRRGN
jgi:membrane protein DedA with SNARE-associated domain